MLIFLKVFIKGKKLLRFSKFYHYLWNKKFITVEMKKYNWKNKYLLKNKKHPKVIIPKLLHYFKLNVNTK